MFDVGPRGKVTLGDYALVHGARIICESEVAIGDYALMSWNVRVDGQLPRADRSRPRAASWSGACRRCSRAASTATADARPIRIGRNVWIGFDSCVLPGVTIGEGSVVGAQSVVD